MGLLVLHQLHPLIFLLHCAYVWAHQLSAYIGSSESSICVMGQIYAIVVGYFWKLRITPSLFSIILSDCSVVFLHNIGLLNWLTRKFVGVLDLGSRVPSPCDLLDVHVHDFFVFAVVIWSQIILVLLVEVKLVSQLVTRKLFVGGAWLIFVRIVVSLKFTHQRVVVTTRSTKINICRLVINVFEIVVIHERVVALASTHTDFRRRWILVTCRPMRGQIPLRWHRLGIKLLLVGFVVIVGCRWLGDWPSGWGLLLNEVLLDVDLEVLRILRHVVIHR